MKEKLASFLAEVKKLNPDLNTYCELTEKYLKALDVIWEKGINIGTFVLYEKYEDYLSDWKLLSETQMKLLIGNKQLTKEEFNLLKEINPVLEGSK